MSADGSTGQLKDRLGAAAIDRLATSLAHAWPDFATGRFRAAAMDGLEELELQARVLHVVDAMSAHLPPRFAVALPLVLRVGEGWERESDPHAGLAVWPLIEWVGVRGLEHPDLALPALRRLTGLFSAEFAIRPFLARHPEPTLRALREWTGDEDEHVRRLVSEGTRPRLPWASRLPAFQADPTPVIELLDALKLDESEYVRRSVANNLNDISKDHPAVAVEVAARWTAEGVSPRLVSHALRTLVKKGDPAALAALGYATEPEVSATLELSPARVRLGETLQLEITMRSTAEGVQRVVVDFAIHFCKANGSTSPKVFKLRNVELQPGTTIELQRRRPLVPATTRRYNSGEHRVELLVSGKPVAEARFWLEVPD